MKNKVMILTIVGILTVGGISVAYAAGRNDTGFSNVNRPMMNRQSSNVNSSYNYGGSMMKQMLWRIGILML